MADATQVIEMIRRIVADDTADLRERLQHLEHRTVGTVSDHPADTGVEPIEETTERDSELQQRLDDIKAIHKLDASPVQWTRDNSGKMVEAPEGVWEITCLACNHQGVWREGDPKPPQCKTWRIANGS